ncbi:hypothetical protein BCR44DRAFT_42536, partial [Catenaria anguillulae PL171]
LSTLANVPRLCLHHIAHLHHGRRLGTPVPARTPTSALVPRSVGCETHSRHSRCVHAPHALDVCCNLMVECTVDARVQGGVCLGHFTVAVSYGIRYGCCCAWPLASCPCRNAIACDWGRERVCRFGGESKRRAGRFGAQQLVTCSFFPTRMRPSQRVH